MHIDVDMLKKVRDIGPFALSPADFEATMVFTAEVFRDNARANPEVVREPGAGVCRVKVTSPTPRLRERLAILGWLPWNPQTDDVWYLDEPVELRAGDSHQVTSLVAQFYAENMNLVFAPDDGMFSGDAPHVEPGANASRDDLRLHLRLLADRAYVALAMIVPRVPATWFCAGVGRALARENAARPRAGLSTMQLPSHSTLGRWHREIRERYRDREGTGRQWRSYGRELGAEVSSTAPSTDAPEPTSIQAPQAKAGSTAATRMSRARIILERIRTAARKNGRWLPIDLAAGRTARVWAVDLGDGLEAWITTRFSGVSDAPALSGYDDALVMQRMPPPPGDDATVDLFMEGVGKVLSIGTCKGQDRIIGMVPGPWEARFGLPESSWPPAVQRRLEGSGTT